MHTDEWEYERESLLRKRLLDYAIKIGLSTIARIFRNGCTNRCHSGEVMCPKKTIWMLDFQL